MTYGEAYEMELDRAAKTPCPHGTNRAACCSSMCYIWTPADDGLDPLAEMTEDQVKTFYAYLDENYNA